MSNEAQNGNFAKPMLAVVVIGKKSFKNADEFKDYCDDAMHDFLDNIQELNGYTYPADGDSLFEYEEGITFYYTKKGSELVHRWIKRMEAIFEKYFPDDECRVKDVGIKVNNG